MASHVLSGEHPSRRRPSHYKTSFRWKLTRRQEEIAALMRSGRTDTEIALAVQLSLDGVKYHVKEILRKQSLSSRRELAAAA